MCVNDVFPFRFPVSRFLQSGSPGTVSLYCSCSSWSSPPLPASSGRCPSPWGYLWWPYTSYSLLFRLAYRNVFLRCKETYFKWNISWHTDVLAEPKVSSDKLSLLRYRGLISLHYSHLLRVQLSHLGKWVNLIKLKLNEDFCIRKVGKWKNATFSVLLMMSHRGWHLTLSWSK